jgi:hypothetical protein
MRRFAIIGLCALAACGGSPDAKNPGNDGKKDDAHESIGEAAAAQGGFASLGGAGNREESTGTEVAFAGPLRLERLSTKNPPKLDGVVKEWQARAPAKETLAGKTDGLDLEVAVQSGDDTLWLAAEIQDASLKRSTAYAPGEDHMTLVLAFPSGRGVLKAYEIGFWPGIPGSSPGAVKWVSGPNAGAKVTGAKLVENDVKGGVTFEATVPWNSFPEAATTRVGMRANFIYHDDGGGQLATGTGGADKPNDLLALPIPAEAAVVEGLLEQKGLSGTKPSIDVYADVAGDDRKERISVFGKFFTICGPGYRGGKQFFWREVAGDLVSLNTSTSLLGRAKEELVVRRRVTAGTAVHEVLEIWSIPDKVEEPQTLFAQEVLIASPDGKKKISNSMHLGSKSMELAIEPPVGWDASSFGEQVAGQGVEPILLPWGAVKSRSFKIENGKVAIASEQSQTPSGSAAKPAVAAAATPPPTDDAPAPVPAAPDMSKAVLSAYMHDANIPAGTKPRFDLAINVDGDSKPERIALFGRDLVVMGPGFKGGTGYARISLAQFSDDKEVSELGSKDLDGDGTQDLIIRGQRHVQASGQTVEVDALFIYKVKEGAIARVFAIETGRAVGDKRVQDQVQFVPAKKGKGFDIDTKPGGAKGWTKDTYPWPQDKPGGSIEPLILPWGGVSGIRYAWNGSTFVPAQ